MKEVIEQRIIELQTSIEEQKRLEAIYRGMEDHARVESKKDIVAFMLYECQFLKSLLL